MAECRQLICNQQADFEITVRYFGGVRERKAFYCTEHLTRVQEAIASRETSEITHIRPIEKGTNMSTEYEQYAAEIAEKEAKIASLEADVTRLTAEIQQANNTIAFANEQIGQFKRAETDLKNSQASLKSIRDALVRLLHDVANSDDGTGPSLSIVDTIDERLEELSLPGRKKHFEMVFIVPVQLRVGGDYATEEAMREAFDAGRITWDVADFEETREDDIEIVTIEEVPQ